MKNVEIEVGDKYVRRIPGGDTQIVTITRKSVDTRRVYVTIDQYEGTNEIAVPIRSILEAVAR